MINEVRYIYGETAICSIDKRFITKYIGDEEEYKKYEFKLNYISSGDYYNSIVNNTKAVTENAVVCNKENYIDILKILQDNTTGDIFDECDYILLDDNHEVTDETGKTSTYILRLCKDKETGIIRLEKELRTSQK